MKREDEIVNDILVAIDEKLTSDPNPEEICELYNSYCFDEGIAEYDAENDIYEITPWASEDDVNAMLDEAAAEDDPA